MSYHELHPRRWNPSRIDRQKLLFKQIASAIAGKSCPICLNHIDDRRAAVITACTHAYCIDCIDKWSKLKRKCPLCNAQFDSWFFRFSFSSRSFCKQKLPPLGDEVKRIDGGDLRRVRSNRFIATRVARSREDSDIGNSRTRPLPGLRSFGNPRTVPPEIIKERILQWRRSDKVKVQAELKSRCSPKQIEKIMSHISKNEELMRAVEQMGFRSLRDVPAMKMDLKFIKKLLDGFDVDSCSLFGEKIEAKDVGIFLGIPAVGNLVLTSISDADKDNFKTKYAGKSLSHLKSEMKSLTRADRTFEETFMLIALGHFLCPCVKDIPSQELYNALSVVSVARQYNWGQFVLGFLLEAIKDYKKERQEM